jgi:phosphate starvation-inducible PhoH-like protein
MRSSFSQNEIFPSKKKKLSELRSLAPVYKPKSENQELYVKYLTDKTVPIVLGIGPAGCGKTLFACVSAINELRSGNIKKVILTRPIVPVEEEELGFLPGSLINKMDPWTRPIFDIFLEFYQQKDLESMIHSGVVEISPLAYMRGRTFKSAYIIADEMQNSTPNQMLMLTTRIGSGSKMAITGDLKQSDRSTSNGLLDIMVKIREQSLIDSDFPIKMVEMNFNDIERSPIVATILKMYQKKMVIGSKEISKKEVGSSPVLSKKIGDHFTGDAALIPVSHMSNHFDKT